MGKGALENLSFGLYDPCYKNEFQNIGGVIGDAAVTAAEIAAAGGALKAGAKKLLARRNLKAIRQGYVTDVSLLEDLGLSARAAGQSAEDTARMLHAERNALKIKYRKLSPSETVKKFELRNLNKYGDPLGPSIEQLRAQGKTWEQIIDSASRSGGGDLGL
jgi:hypothetical protein